MLNLSKPKRRIAVATIAAVSALAMIAGCTGNDAAEKSGPQNSSIQEGPESGPDDIYGPTPTDPTEGGTLTVATLTEPPSLDPYHSQADARVVWSVLMYQGLMYAGGSAGNVVPLLAKSMDISEDGLTYTFPLRSGVKFSDGTPMTAADVKYSYDYIRNPDNGSPAATDMSTIKDITIPDDETVVFHLSKRNSALPMTLSNKWGGVVPKDYFAEPNSRESFNSKSVGTGPYELVEFKKNAEMTLKKNPNYWDEGSYIDKIKVVFLQSQAAIDAALNSGQVDLAQVSLITNAKKLVQNPKIKVQTFRSINQKALDFGLEQKPLDNVKVRQAMASAMSKETLAQASAPDSFELLGTVPAAMQDLWGLPLDQVAFQKQDVAKAKKLLAEAGFPDGFDITLTSINGYSWMDAAAAVVVSDLAEVGINVKVNKVDLGTWIDAFNNNKMGFTFNDWATQPDPSLLFYQHFHTRPEGRDYRNWENAKASKVLDEGLAAITSEQRKAVYDEFQTELADSVPTYMIYSPKYLVATSSRVQNYVQSPTGWGFGFAKAFLTE